MNVYGYLLNILFKNYGSGGIRTHASEETGALNQRLRPLGHATHWSKVINLCLRKLQILLIMGVSQHTICSQDNKYVPSKTQILPKY